MLSFFILVYGLQIPVLLFGIASNVLNILVFRSSGQRDSVSLGFTALSIADLGYCVTFCTVRICGMLSRTGVDFPTAQACRVVMTWVVWLSVLFQDASVLITVFVAVQKCCCVAIPHLFRDVFNPRRSVQVMLALTLGIALTYVPIFAGLSVKRIESPESPNKTTTIAIHKYPIYLKGVGFWKAFNRMILPPISQVILFVCLLVIVVQLKKSAEFRSSSDINSNNESGSQQAQKSAASAKLGHKERRAVTAVALVLVIYCVSSLPSTVLRLASHFAADVFKRPAVKSIHTLVTNMQNILTHVNASINTFVYLKYNTKFKDTAAAIFCRR